MCVCTAPNKATNTPPDSSKANIDLQLKTQDSFLTKNNAGRFHSRFSFLVLWGWGWGADFNGNAPTRSSEHALSHKWHDKSGDL